MMAQAGKPSCGMLPSVRGTYRYDADLSKTTWFRAGGHADVLFRPADEEDLALFLAALDPAMAVTVIGAGSNVIVRDRGIRGVTLRLGRGFMHMKRADNEIEVGAALPDRRVAHAAAACGIAGLEFLCGIPGSIGGALRMNAGAYGREIRDIVVGARAIDRHGAVHDLTHRDLRFGYRTCGVPDDWIFTSCRLQGTAGNTVDITAAMTHIDETRERTQPVRERTGGSTFKNPDGCHAWELIDNAGCRGLRRGAAIVSPHHCNFLINTGNATADDLEGLGEEVRLRVYRHSAVDLEWEIRRLGTRAPDVSAPR